MEVILAKTAGFCFGVKRAVDTVYKEAGKKNVYTYGPIIHNSEVVNDLKKKGVEVINSREELEALEEGTVIIRSHGVAREIYDLIHEKGLELVDATCPFVRKIHKIVEKAGNDGDQVIIVEVSTTQKFRESKDGVLEKCILSQMQSSLKGSILTSRRLLYHKRHLITRNFKI